MLMDHAAKSVSLNAPPGDGQTLIDPPSDALEEIVAANRLRLADVSYDVQGRSLQELADSARRGLWTQAVAHTARYRNVPARLTAKRGRDGRAIADAPFLLSGHQPELYHPGVWYKNFVLGRLGREMEGVAIHLLIDSDMCRSVSLRVLTGSVERPRVEAVAYDEPAAEVPYEERTIRDSAVLASFAERARRTIEPLVHEPIVEELWPLVERNSEQTKLGLRLAEGRHALEGELGNETLELPQSAVCQLPEFAWFVAHLLAHLPRFWTAHNDALAEYRAAHRMRTRAHPVPDLAESGGWLEAPFWIWTQDDPRRRQLFAQQRDDELWITDRHQQTHALRLTADGDAAPAAEQLLSLAERGVKLRTRALATTLFARLVLGDLFLHGIGGAKYDQVTNRIAESFCGFALPEFATVSATLRLPADRRPEKLPPAGRWRRQLRELDYHPERFLESNGDAVGENVDRIAEIVAGKRRWIETEKTPANARERHRAIAAANDALQRFLAPLRQQLESQHENVEWRRRAAAILDSREYSFCLFPRSRLEALLLDGPNARS